MQKLIFNFKFALYKKAYCCIPQKHNTRQIRISKAPNGRHISLAVAVGNINVVVGTKNRSLGTYNNKSTDVNFILKNLNGIIVKRVVGRKIKSARTHNSFKSTLVGNRMDRRYKYRVYKHSNDRIL